jgi:hypothetical protein
MQPPAKRSSGINLARIPFFHHNNLYVGYHHREGPLLDGVKRAIAEHAGENAAKRIVAGVAFEVTETRPLVAMG